jgi:hypothetical protein
MEATHSACCHRGHHCPKCAHSRPPAPMDPLHLPATTNQAHDLCYCARETPPTNHHHYLTKTGLRCGASRKGTTPMAPPSHVQRWTGFTPLRTPCSRDMVPHNGTPAGSMTPKGTATIATDRDVGEGLRPTQHRASRMFLTKHLLAFASPPPEEARHSLKHHHGTTSEHQPAPSPTSKVAPDQHQHGEATAVFSARCPRAVPSQL